MSDDNDTVVDPEDRTAQPRAVTARLAQLTNALDARGLTVVKQSVYHDDHGDGTGAVAWLWLCADPRRFPEEGHDLLVTFSEADGDWSVATPHGGHLRIPATGDTGDREDIEAIAQTLVAASAGTVPEDLTTRAVPDWLLLVLSGAATSVVVPFVQAVIGKSAEDAYNGLRSLLSRRTPVTRSSGGTDDGEYLSIVDPGEDIQLIVADPVPAAAVRQLAAMDVSELRGRVLVWDEDRQEWFRCRRT